MKFDAKKGWHFVDSWGLSTWEGEDFTDEIDVNRMHSQGLVQLVDGRDELRQTGHVLVGQAVQFLPTGAEGQKTKMRTAKIVGWWPQDALPPVATERGERGARQAVFVAEEPNGDRWQLPLASAMVAAVPHSVPSNAKVLEVFASSCELSLALRRQGLQAVPYGQALSSDQDFAADDAFLHHLAEGGYLFAHFSPPPAVLAGRRQGVAPVPLEKAFLSRLCGAIATLHGRDVGFALEADESSGLWGEPEVNNLGRFAGVQTISADLKLFGASRPRRVRLLTNRAAWLAPSLTSARKQKAAVGESSLRFPMAFCDAYAEALASGLSQAGTVGSPKRRPAPSHKRKFVAR